MIFRGSGFEFGIQELRVWGIRAGGDGREGVELLLRRAYPHLREVFGVQDGFSV